MRKIRRRTILRDYARRGYLTLHPVVGDRGAVRLHTKLTEEGAAVREVVEFFIADRNGTWRDYLLEQVGARSTPIGTGAGPAVREVGVR